MNYRTPAISFRKRIARHMWLPLFFFMMLLVYGIVKLGFWMGLLFTGLLIPLSFYGQLRNHKYQLTSLKRLNEEEIELVWMVYDREHRQVVKLDDLELKVRPVPVRRRLFVMKIMHQNDLLLKLVQNDFWDEKKLKEIADLKYDSVAIAYIF